MKKLLTSVLVVPLLLLMLGSTANGSTRPQAGTKFFFDGTTSQGQEDFFIMEKDSPNCGGVGFCFEPFFATTVYVCPDGTTAPFEWLFLNYFIPVNPDGTFEISIQSTQFPFDWKGTLSGKHASGTQNQGYVSYATTGGVQDCDVGDVTWQSTGVGGTPHTGSTRGIVATVEKLPSGKTQITLTRG